MDFSALITKFVVFITIMLLGYILARRGILSRDFTRGASRLTLDVFMSATILYSVMSDPPEMSGRELLWVLFAVCCGMLLTYAIAAAAARVLPGRGRDKPVFELLMGVPNTMFIALPVLQQVLGGEVVFYVALSNIPFNLLLYTYGVWRLRGGGKGARLRLKDMMSVPLIATLISVPLFLFHVQVPSVINQLASTLSGATMPMSMLVIGSSLGGLKPREAFSDKDALIVSAVRLIAAPLLVWLIMGLFIDDAFLLTTVTVMAGCPSGIIVSVLSIQNGRDGEYSSKAILTSTALSMLTIPALVYLLM